MQDRSISLERPTTPKKASLTRNRVLRRGISLSLTPFGLTLHRTSGSHRYEHRFFDTAHTVCDAYTFALIARRDYERRHTLFHLTLHTLLAEVIQIQGPRLLFHLSCSLPPNAIEYIVADHLLVPLTESVLLIDGSTTDRIAEMRKDILCFAPKLIITQRSFSAGWAAFIGLSSIAPIAEAIASSKTHTLPRPLHQVKHTHPRLLMAGHFLLRLNSQ